MAWIDSMRLRRRADKIRAVGWINLLVTIIVSLTHASEWSHLGPGLAFRSGRRGFAKRRQDSARRAHASITKPSHPRQPVSRSSRGPPESSTDQEMSLPAFLPASLTERAGMR